MDERAIPKVERGECEPDAGAMLSLVPPGSWPALALLREIALVGPAEQKESPTPPVILMEVTDQSAPDPSRDLTAGGGQADRQTTGPQTPAQPAAQSPAAGGEPPVGPATRPAADAWTKVAVRATRGRFPSAVRAVAEQMLIEGASPEEVVQAAHDRGLVRLKRGTVQHWLESNPELREQALRRQAETAEALRRSLAADRGSPEARLAEAALFAGLSRPLKRGSRFVPGGQADLDVSMREQLERENRLLRRQAERLEQRKRSITRRIIRARLRLERMRWSLLERHVSQLYSAIEGDVRDEALAPELLEGLRRLRRLTGGRRKKSTGPDAA
jgi:hypothetical protein